LEIIPIATVGRIISNLLKMFILYENLPKPKAVI